jgi:hypothetical protein
MATLPGLAGPGSAPRPRVGRPSRRGSRRFRPLCGRPGKHGSEDPRPGSCGTRGGAGYLPEHRRPCRCEAVWVPTTLLPRFGVTWSATDPHHIAATYFLDETKLELRYVLADDGQVRSVALERWADPHNTGTYGYHPFGFDVTSHASFDGVTITSAGRGGWFFGKERWAEGGVHALPDHRLPARNGGHETAP